MRLTRWDLPNETYPMRLTWWDLPNETLPNETLPKETLPNETLPSETLPNETYPMRPYLKRLIPWDYPMRLECLMQIVTKHSSPFVSGYTGMYPFTIHLVNETIQVQKFQRRIVKTYMCTMTRLFLKNKTHGPLEKWC